MGKPSIFSREYDRKMKARKKRKTIIIVTLIAAALIIATRASFLNWLQKNAGQLNSKDKGSSGYLTQKGGNDSDKAAQDTGNDKKDQSSQETPPADQAAAAEKVLELNMPDGKKIKMVYEENNGNKVIKNVMSDDNSVQFYMNPSANKVVLLNAAQDMFIADLNGNLSNITKAQYITSSGSVIQKSAYLQRKPGFLWHSTPRFINDTTVVYITQMPWFKTTKYVYKVDLNNASVHTRLQVIQGENVSFDAMDPKGLKVNTDAGIKFITSDGNVTQ